MDSKKIILFATAGIFCNQVYAQTSVTLYGIIDSGFTYVNNQNGARNFEATSGKLSGSRFGFKGFEDLGNGNKVVFVLENGFSGFTGALAQGGRLFGRQAYVGLSNDAVGTLTFGRQYAPIETYVGYLSAALRFGTSNITDPFDLDFLGGSVRFNNAVDYESPDYWGFTYNLQYAFSNQASADNGQGFANNREYGAAAKYNRGPVHLGIGFASLSRPAAASNANGATVGDYPGAFPLWLKEFDTKASGKPSNATFTIGSEKVIAGSGVYQYGNLGFGAVISRTLLNAMTIAGSKTPGFNTTNGSFAMNAFELSTTYSMTPANQIGVMVKYAQSELQTGSRQFAPHWWEFDIANDYAFSKRTDAYISIAYEVASGANNVAQMTLDAPSSNREQVAVTVGLRHRF